MLVTMIDLFDVPAALGTLLTFREANSYAKFFGFRNWTASAIAVRIEETPDGGTTWNLVGTQFDVGAVGSGTDIITKHITSTNMLRIRGSGGGNDRDLEIGVSRVYKDTARSWPSPIL